MVFSIFGVFIIGGAIVSFFLGIFQIVASRQLKEMRGESQVSVTAIISMLPLTPLFLINFPVAIWVLVFTGQKQTRDAFALVDHQTSSPVPAQKIPPKIDQ